jgi:V/A-type H+/Na+-transporting ATPase subunit I
VSITRLTKVTLFGSDAEQKAALSDLQSLGCVHLISMREESKPVALTAPEWNESVAGALRHLIGGPQRRHQEIDPQNFKIEEIVKAALKNKEQQREAADRRISLRSRISQLSPWGNFTLPPLDEMGGYRLWFYRIPHRELKRVNKLTDPWEVVAKDHGFAYVVVISKDEPRPDILPVPRTHAGEVALDEVKRNLQRVELEIEDLAAEQNALSRWIDLLSRNLAIVEDERALERAARQSREIDKMFVVQGWSPSPDLPALQRLAEAKGIALLQEEPGPDEMPPTLMDNPVPFQGGEDLVTFYETPGYRSWDPSWIVASSFAIFFAMILSDAGYALVLAAILFLARNKLGDSAGGRRFRLLMSGVLAVAFVYGVLAGSYFGIEPPQGSLLGALHLLHLQDTLAMMQVSLVVGCAHLIVANAASSLHATTLAGKLKPVGWIAVISGGLFLFLSRGTQAEQVMWKIGSGLIAGGLMLIILFGSNRQVKSFGSALLRLLGGLGALFDISKIFGDALSYLRLFALGLASASLAITFNQIGSQIGKNIPGLGILLAIIILLAGHALNLLLGIISGFVHGLRLNYIEFFKWAISEEGYPFKAFRKMEVKS